MRIKSSPSTAQRLALFRDEIRKYYTHIRKPGAASRVAPSAHDFYGYAKIMSDQIAAEEKKRHEEILRSHK